MAKVVFRASGIGLLILMGMLLAFSSQASAAQIGDLQTRNIVLLQLNDKGQVAWIHDVGEQTLITLYDGGASKTVTSTASIIPRMSMNNLGQIVWHEVESDTEETKLLLYSGGAVTRLSANNERPIFPRINDAGQIVYTKMGSSRLETILYSGGQQTRLIGTGYSQMKPQINNLGQVTWIGTEGSDANIYYYSSGIKKISDGDNNYFIYKTHAMHQINDQGHIAWITADGTGRNICLYDGSAVTRLTTSGGARGAVINNLGQVVWQEYDGNDWEIFIYDGGQVRQLTANDQDDECPYINDQGAVVWQGGDGSDTEIFVYSGGRIMQMTDNGVHDVYPRLNNQGLAAWLTKNAAGEYQGVFVGSTGDAVLADARSETIRPDDRARAGKADVKYPVPDAQAAVDAEPDIDPLYSFVVLGDSRGQDVTSWLPWTRKFPEKFLGCLSNTIIRRFKPNFVAFVADMATYPQVIPMETSNCYLHGWKKTFVDPLTAAGIEFLPSIGNHETFTIPTGEKPSSVSYGMTTELFPKLIPGNGYIHWFYPPLPKFSFGHIVFNTYTMRTSKDYDVNTVSPKQLSSFDTDSKAFDQMEKEGIMGKFRFAFSHAPITKYPNDPKMVALKEKLIKNNFKLFFCGHVHLYVRSDLTYDPTYPEKRCTLSEVLVGCAGVPPEGQASIDKYKNNPATDAVTAKNTFAHVQVSKYQVLVTVYVNKGDVSYNHCYQDSDWVCFDRFRFDWDGEIETIPCPPEPAK